jgi:hypothetical protein
VFGHGDRQQNLNLKPGLARIQKRYLPAYQTRLLELPNSPPAGAARQAGNLGEFRLAAGRVFLQGI